MATKKRRVKDLRRGDQIKLEGEVVTVETGVICFKRNNDACSFDIRRKDFKTCSSISFKDPNKEVALVKESPHEPIPEELRVMDRSLEKPKRKRKKKKKNE